MVTDESDTICFLHVYVAHYGPGAGKLLAIAVEVGSSVRAR